MYNMHCQPAPRWTRSEYYWYSRLLYTGDSACLTATVGPLHAGHVSNATGTVVCFSLETQHTTTAGLLHAENVTNTTGIFLCSILETLYVY